uniref:AB hydrolase-1 domain-containing protein n=1 Tax=Ramularia collo-cygni TaxID=112498 RepID=A0A2D3V8A3_9PEZI
MELIQRPSSIRNICIVLAAAPAIGFLAARLWRLASQEPIQTRLSIYRAPRDFEGESNLPYPPNALPGARDIETPYGVTRAYEFGPEDGRKVLLIHGISTPCLSMACLAKVLSANGCRVCCYDLLGRGLSDAPNPSTHRQDFALFSSQIFAVITSSPLDWCGEGFSIVGYSLGGGIATCFASYFPKLVHSLVLLAPAGVIRPGRMTRASEFIYGGYLPEAVVERLVTMRMKLTGGEPALRSPPAADAAPVIASTITNETPDPATSNGGWIETFEGVRICPDKAVEWQLDFHPGFIPSFVSTLRNGPIYDNHERLRIIGRRCEISSGSLAERQVLLILGKQDTVILAKDTVEDMSNALGKNNIKVVELPGGHDLPIVNSVGCADAMLDFWGSA